MTKIENKAQYDWAVNRVEELLPLVDDNTPKDCLLYTSPSPRDTR